MSTWSFSAPDAHSAASAYRTSTDPDAALEHAPHNARLLLVEDNSADVFVIKEILSEKPVSFDLVVARDGQHAIEILNDLDKDSAIPAFDLAVIDLNLPKRSGHDVIAHLRATNRVRALPVIVITSSVSRDDVARSRALGISAYFQKQPDLDAYWALGDLVLQVLQTSRNQ